ncbi:MAG: cytochrome c biogenesis protein ResB, partial [Bacteroidales bacterium]|nr:cytochrome c biogenesis protein ResB [Bacteroidales bacterium]
MVRFVLNHIGLLFVLIFGTLSLWQREQLEMSVMTGTAENRAIEPNTRKVTQMPFVIELNQLIVEEKPRMRYASEITITDTKGERQSATVEVNHPYKTHDWNIYQYSYDEGESDGTPPISVFLLVYDCWLPGVFIGIYMMLCGALLMLWKRISR